MKKHIKMAKINIYEPYGYMENERFSSIRTLIDDEIMANKNTDEQQSEEISAETTARAEEDVRINERIDALEESDGSISEKISELSGKTEELDAKDEELEASIEHENSRAMSAETSLSTSIANERSRAEAAENALQDALDIINGDGEGSMKEAAAMAVAEVVAGAPEDYDTLVEIAEYIEADKEGAAHIVVTLSNHTQAISALQEDLESEVSRATSAETAIASDLSSEVSRATSKEDELEASIATKASATALEELGTEIDSLDESVDSLSQNLSALTSDVSEINNKVESISGDVSTNATDISALEERVSNMGDTFNNFVSGSYESDKADIYAAIDDAKHEMEQELSGKVATINVAMENMRSDLQIIIDSVDDKVDAFSASTEEALDNKADASTVYTQDEVDALLLKKENEIYNLTKIVGDMGGAVTYNLPNEAGKSFNALMSNNGTVKLSDDVTSSRFGPGITAKNNVKLNLNSHNLTISGLTTSSTQAAIMSRGTMDITIYGKGTIDAGGGICVESYGADSTITLSGSTTVYQTNRPNGELIYCYSGVINILNGTFKNNGSKYLLNCYDANYANGTAKIIVSGGKFYDFDPAHNEAEGANTSFLADGYESVASVVVEDDGEHTVYTVKKITV